MSNQNTKGQSMPLKTIECNCSTYGKHGLHDPKCDSLKISKWKEELGDLIENWPDLDNSDSCYSLSKEVIRTVKALLTSQKAEMMDTLIEEVNKLGEFNLGRYRITEIKEDIIYIKKSSVLSIINKYKGGV